MEKEKLEFERKVGHKGEIIIPEKFRTKIGIGPETNVLVCLKDRKIYIELEKEDPVIVFKQIAETKPIIKKISPNKSYEEEIEKKME